MKSFYDLSLGGSQNSKAAAIAWRDQKLAELEAFTLLEFHKQKRSNNLSGVPGVHFHKTPSQPLGFWQATIRFTDGKRLAKSFSVRKHGKREAFRLAVAARNDLLERVENRSYLKNTLAKRLSKVKV